MLPGGRPGPLDKPGLHFTFARSQSSGRMKHCEHTGIWSMHRPDNSLVTGCSTWARSTVAVDLEIFSASTRLGSVTRHTTHYFFDVPREPRHVLMWLNQRYVGEGCRQSHVDLLTRRKE